MKQWITSKPLRKESLWLIGALVVLLVCIWPIRTLQKLPAQHAALQEQSMQVQMLAQEATYLRTQVAALSSSTPEVALQALVQQLAGTASVSIEADKAVMTFKELPQSQLMAVLESLRKEVRAQIEQLQLREQTGLISGRVQLQLPQEH